MDSKIKKNVSRSTTNIAQFPGDVASNQRRSNISPSTEHIKQDENEVAEAYDT